MIDQSLRDALAHLPRLIVFAELAKQESFRGTAKVLGLSPSTVTHHIKALETALGVRLIERTSRSMTLTAAGSTLLTEAQGIVQGWRRGSRNAQAYADAPMGTLTVTAPDVIAECVVVPVIEHLTSTHPHVTVDLIVSTQNLDLLAMGIDVAVRLGPLADSGLGMRLLHQGSHQVVATPELAAQWPAEHPAELQSAPWVQFGNHPPVLPMRGPGGQSFGLRGQYRVRSTSAAAYVALIRQGIGFGLVPTVVVDRELRSGELQTALAGWSLGPANFYAVTPSPRATDVKVRLFTDTLARAFRDGHV